MTTRTTLRFRQQLAELLATVQQQAQRAYRQFENDPWHSSLRFKRVHPSLPIYSARIAKGYRAVGKRDEQGMLWFWIGSDAAYDALVERL